VHALNKAAGLFVLPSYHEGRSIAALEALHAKVPVLLSDIEANIDIGLPAKHYFKAGSREDLAAKLSEDWQSFGGQDLDLSPFDWELIARATLNELEKAMAVGAALVRERR